MNRAGFGMGTSFHLSYTVLLKGNSGIFQNKGTSLSNFVLNSGLRKFCFGISIAETCYWLGSTKVDAQNMINWTVIPPSSDARPLYSSPQSSSVHSKIQWRARSIRDNWYLSSLVFTTRSALFLLRLYAAAHAFCARLASAASSTPPVGWPAASRLCSIDSFVNASSALTLLVRRQKEHPAIKNWVKRCWCGYLSGTRCRLFAYGPTDATASHNPIISCLI